MAEERAPPRNPLIVIPARLASTRLPGKPLAEIHGEAMIVHVWRRAAEAGLGPVVVACAEPEIAAAVRAAGGEALVTEGDHASGSDRVFEAVERLDPEAGHDVVVNLQGDLPTLDPAAVRAALRPLAEPAVDIATLVAEITEAHERRDPNVTKAALAIDERTGCGRALYFSRSPVPWPGADDSLPLYHHIGLYAFRRPALARFVALPASPLERRERLEQLRALEAGMRIDAALVDTVPLGVDTPADLERARAALAPSAAP
ncbi:MAG: 3-deoxy-manno-octulosonate cytidylyltransferase [Kiloniellales bacterium]|nr:3-deoxy-manno-octulosonate cytidylyltransferase [Kiloniellales bacterium]